MKNKVIMLLVAIPIMFLCSCQVYVQSYHIKWAEDVCKDNNGLRSIEIPYYTDKWHSPVALCNNGAIFKSTADDFKVTPL